MKTINILKTSLFAILILFIAVSCKSSQNYKRKDFVNLNKKISGSFSNSDVRDTANKVKLSRFFI